VDPVEVLLSVNSIRRRSASSVGHSPVPVALVVASSKLCENVPVTYPSRGCY
jgi:hypothetical protein